jgi:hypothetical protein
MTFSLNSPETGTLSKQSVQAAKFLGKISVYFLDSCKFTTIIELQVRKLESALRISDLAGDSSSG